MKAPFGSQAARAQPPCQPKSDSRLSPWGSEAYVCVFGEGKRTVNVFTTRVMGARARIGSRLKRSPSFLATRGIQSPFTRVQQAANEHVLGVRRATEPALTSALRPGVAHLRASSFDFAISCTGVWQIHHRAAPSTWRAARDRACSNHGGRSDRARSSQHHLSILST